MKLVYVYHSGIALLMDKCSILFDFYEDSNEDGSDGFVHQELLNDEKPLYVFVSHFHQDHFNPIVLNFQHSKKNIKFILSNDIHKRRNNVVKAHTDADITFLKKGETYEDEYIKTKAFGSTDTGVSFYVECEGKKLFHSGDLNNWHWIDESTQEEAHAAEQAYLKELSEIKAQVPKLDLAMFPIDYRLGSQYMRGAEQFVDAIACKYFCPIHFSAFGYEKLEPFIVLGQAYHAKVLDIQKRGQIFELKQDDEE